MAMRQGVDGDGDAGMKAAGAAGCHWLLNGMAGLLLAGGSGVAAAEVPASPAPASPAVSATSTAAAAAPASSPETPAAPAARQQLPEVVVTATRTPHALQDVPASVKVVSGEEMRTEKMVETMPDALKDTPGVMLQKTSNGQTSPYIRGFTGFRNLLMVDGVRFNNAVFRDGPNQYWTLVDPYALDRVEVVKGPGSVLYGSDAVGGVVNAITQDTGLQLAPGAWERHLFTRVASADKSVIVHGDVDGNVDGRLGYHVGGSWKDFNDVRGGREVGTQPQTGYDEWNGDLKLEYLTGPDQKLTLAHLHTTQDDVWRTHRTVYGIDWEGATHGTDRRLSYDQEYDLTYLQFHAAELGGPVDAVHAGVSWQTMDEEENRVKKDLTSQIQGFTVNTAGMFLTLESPSPVGRWSYGVDYYHDEVDSYSDSYNAAGKHTASGIQGPVADDAGYDTAGVFVQDEIPFGERVDLVLGARGSWINADAGAVRDPKTGRQTSIQDDWGAVTGQGRLLVGLDEKKTWQWFAGVGQSFRAPNLSDLTRFDIARSGEVEIAAPGLKPERYVTYETGIKTEHAGWGGELAFFHTDIRDMIVRVPTGETIGGNRVVSKKNAGDGELDGVELGAHLKATDEVTLFGSFTWMDGEVEGYPTSAASSEREPLSRLMPVTVNGGVKYEPLVFNRKLFVQVDATMAAEQDRLASGDRADTQRFPPDGTPGYTVWNVRGGYKITPDVHLTVALENVFNADYRIHGSGVNEPGRNLIAALDVKF